MKPALDDLSVRLGIACTLAREAGRLMQDSRGMGTGTSFSMKGHQDFLTVVDGQVEALVRRRLAEAFPGDSVMGEEAGGDIGERLWVVDPIDGTANFARGIGHYCISLAFLAGSEILLGVIYDPTRDELFAAVAGRGATLNGRPIAVSTVTDPRRSSVECGWSMRLPIAEWVALVGRICATGAGLYRCGSGALGMAYVAAGRLEAYCELHINSWDVLAGILLVREAGGLTNDFLAGDGLVSGNPILACTPALADQWTRATGIPLG
jgi:myo-inositol-1(or 4)-monophosphatase